MKYGYFGSIEGQRVILDGEFRGESLLIGDSRRQREHRELINLCLFKWLSVGFALDYSNFSLSKAYPLSQNTIEEIAEKNTRLARDAFAYLEENIFEPVRNQNGGKKYWIGEEAANYKLKPEVREGLEGLALDWGKSKFFLKKEKKRTNYQIALEKNWHLKAPSEEMRRTGWHSVYWSYLLHLPEQGIYHKKSRFGRIFTTFSGIPKEMRREIVVSRDGSRTVEVDVSNSQPFFVACLFNGILGNDETREFLDEARQGKTYDSLLGWLFGEELFWLECWASKEAETSLSGRDAVKMAFLGFIYGCSARELDPVRAYFKKRFPSLLEKMKELRKKEGYKWLAQEAQRLESGVIIPVCRALSLPSLHDGFLCPESKVEEAFNMLKNNCLSQFGTSPKIRILKNENQN